MLEPEYITIPLDAGSDERTYDLVQDASQSPIRRITNGVFEKLGGISKRPGFTRDGLDYADPVGVLKGGTLLSTGSKAAVHRPLDLLGYTDTYGTSTAGSQAALHARVDTVFEVHDGRPLKGGQAAVATVSGVRYVCVAATAEPRDGGANDCLVVVAELDTGVVLRRDIIADVQKPRVVVLSNQFGVFAEDTTNLDIDLYIYNPTSAGSVSRDDNLSVVTSLTSGSYWDAVGDGTTALLAYSKSGANQYEVLRFDSGGNTADSVTTAAAAAVTHVTLCVGTSSAVHVVFATAANTYLESYNSALTQTTGPTVVFASATVPLVAFLPGASPLLFISTFAGNHVTITEAHGSLSSPFALPNHYPTTKGLGLRYATGENSRPFIGLLPYDSATISTDQTYFHQSWLTTMPLGGMTIDGNSLAATGGELAASIRADSVFRTGSADYWPAPWLQDGTTGDYYCAQDVVVAYNANLPEDTGIAVVRLRTAVSGPNGSATSLPKATLGGQAYVGGGLLRSWDGFGFGEVVPLPPRAITVADAGGSNLTAGTYGYRVVLVWEDAAGELHRSAPSVLGTRVHDGTGGMTVTIDPAGPTMWNMDAKGQWRAELYRTVVNGSTFFLQQSKPIGDGRGGVVTFATDNTTDAVLSGNRVLYSTGAADDELQNEPPPAFRALMTHQGRLFGVSAQQPTVVWFSKPKAELIAPEFNAANVLVFDAPVVAMASLDEKAVFFTDREAYAVLGDGPDAFGAGSYQAPERITNGVGATGPKAAVACPLGIIVHSPAGFQLVERDLSTRAIDLLSETFPASKRIGAAHYFPTREEVWFTAEAPANGDLVVFDVSGGELRALYWTLTDTTDCAYVHDLDEFGGDPIMLTESATGQGRFFRMFASAPVYTDDGTWVGVTVQLAWFMPGGPGGACKFRQVQVRGRCQTGEGTNVQLQCVVETMHPTENYGGPSPDVASWATDLETPAATHLVRRHRPRRMDGSGIRPRLLISQVSGAGAATAKGPTLFDVIIEYGVRRRLGPKTGGARAPS